MLRRLIDRFRPRSANDQPAEAPAQRDYAQERADRHRGQMSEEDRAWESASQQRERERREQTQPPPVP